MGGAEGEGEGSGLFVSHLCPKWKGKGGGASYGDAERKGVVRVGGLATRQHWYNSPAPVHSSTERPSLVLRGHFTPNPSDAGMPLISTTPGFLANVFGTRYSTISPSGEARQPAWFSKLGD